MSTISTKLEEISSRIFPDGHCEDCRGDVLGHRSILQLDCHAASRLAMTRLLAQLAVSLSLQPQLRQNFLGGMPMQHTGYGVGNNAASIDDGGEGQAAYLVAI
jgi:hypothetical protein